MKPVLLVLLLCLPLPATALDLYATLGELKVSYIYGTPTPMGQAILDYLWSVK